MYKNQINSQAPWLHHLWLELTPACNLECGHCYAESSPHKPLHQGMTHQHWKRVMLEGRHVGCSSVQFIGGEPTILPYFPELVSYAEELKYDHIEVFTNCTKITDSLVDVLKPAGADVACSFYSAEAQTHDQVTGRPGSFARTIAGIERILASGLGLRIAIIEMDINRGHLAAARALLEKLGVASDRISYDFVRPVGRAEDATQSKTSGLCGQCWKGRLCVTSNGITYPCIMSRKFPVGNILENDLTTILHGAALRTARHDIATMYPQNNNSCTPMDCTPNRYCGPDGLCGPGVIRDQDIQAEYLSCTPMDCTPNRYCGPDGLCGPGVIHKVQVRKFET